MRNVNVWCVVTWIITTAIPSASALAQDAVAPPPEKASGATDSSRFDREEITDAKRAAAALGRATEAARQKPMRAEVLQSAAALAKCLDDPKTNWSQIRTEIDRHLGVIQRANDALRPVVVKLDAARDLIFVAAQGAAEAADSSAGDNGKPPPACVPIDATLTDLASKIERAKAEGNKARVGFLTQHFSQELQLRRNIAKASQSAKPQLAKLFQRNAEQLGRLGDVALRARMKVAGAQAELDQQLAFWQQFRQITSAATDGEAVAGALDGLAAVSDLELDELEADEAATAAGTRLDAAVAAINARLGGTPSGPGASKASPLSDEEIQAALAEYSKSPKNP